MRYSERRLARMAVWRFAMIPGAGGIILCVFAYLLLGNGIFWIAIPAFFVGLAAAVKK